jgi:manganese/zinc/iron transport system permease protein
MNELLTLDFPPLLTALFASLCCSLLGNFLVLRRMGLMGDAISHAVLPGIVISFLVTSSRATWPIFVGATISAVLCSLLIGLLRRIGKIDPGASMGVVFSVFFALGVLLIEQAAARHVDLDADCLLHGQLETIMWLPPHNWSELPRQLTSAVLVFCVIVAFLKFFWKELVLVAFDSSFATAIGAPHRLVEQLFLVVLAAAVVASFEAVGSILVIAMLICPAAIARLYADELRTQFLISTLVTVFSVVFGYLLATLGAAAMGFDKAWSVAGSVVVVIGITFAVAATTSKNYGIFRKA